ncbi:hypothetical protein HanRHA438_Chr04g0193391 [Helianthus annuus]|nr:hypothetical protein HanRHA438_Chr04g0193391 [Helianthus annuus]
MNAYMSWKDKDMHVVLLIQFGVLKLYKGKRIVSNAFDATRLFINNDIDDIKAFKKKKSVVIVGTIKSICTEKLWYYNACNVCKFKVQQKYITIEKEDGTCDVGDEKVFKCTNKSCNARDISPVYRFVILKAVLLLFSLLLLLCNLLHYSLNLFVDSKYR